MDMRIQSYACIYNITHLFMYIIWMCKLYIYIYIYAMLIMYKNCAILGQNKCNSFLFLLAYVGVQ